MKKMLFVLLALASVTFASDRVTLTKSNTIVFNEPFYSDTVANLSLKFQEMDAALKGNDPIYLILDTPGGSIQAGVEFCSFVAGLNRPVHTMSIFAASMGFHTVQCVPGKRLVFDQGILMSHKARGGFSGEFPGQLDSRYNMYLQRIKDMNLTVVARTGKKHNLKSYEALIENEYWCVGKECISQGFADEVVVAKCDGSLNGTKTVLWDRFMYQGHTIEIFDIFSNCPLITGALEYKIYVDGNPLYSFNKDGNKIENSLGYYIRPLELTRDLEDTIKEKIVKAKEELKNREVIKGY